MSQRTVWRGKDREFYLSPEQDEELICIFPDGGSCIWTRQDGRWHLTAARNQAHIGCAAKKSFSEMLDLAYASLHAKVLLED